MNDMRLLQWALERTIIPDRTPIATDKHLLQLAEEHLKDSLYTAKNILEKNPSFDPDKADDIESRNKSLSYWASKYKNAYNELAIFFKGENPSAFAKLEEHDDKVSEYYAIKANILLQKNFQDQLTIQPASEEYETNMMRIYKAATASIRQTIQTLNEIIQVRTEAAIPDFYLRFRQEEVGFLRDAAQTANTLAGQKRAEISLATAGQQNVHVRD